MTVAAFTELLSAYLGAIGAINFLRSVAGKSDYTFFIESGGGFCGNKETLQSLFQQHFHTLSGGIFFLASFISAVIAIVLQPVLDAYVLIAATGTVCIATLGFFSLFPILSYTEKFYTAKKYSAIKKKMPKLERKLIAEQEASNNETNGSK